MLLVKHHFGQVLHPPQQIPLQPSAGRKLNDSYFSDFHSRSHGSLYAFTIAMTNVIEKISSTTLFVFSSMGNRKSLVIPLNISFVEVIV